MRKTPGQRIPHRLGYLPRTLQSHLAIHNRAKHQTMVLRTDRDKIETWLTVVIS